MKTERVCKECGAALPADAPQGLCPQCVMKAGLGSQAQTVVANPGSSAAPSLEDIARHFPQLEILSEIGRGGMGIVYKARQKHLDRMVALKILPPHISSDPSFAERFAREARALARLNHPNIVGIFDSGQTDRLFYFVMEYVDGTNLRQALQAKQISPREALAIVPLICDALQYAHDMGIVHRDIKPENVLLDTKGRVKIADFGLAKLINPGLNDPSLTLAGTTMGTPRYMAPEQMDRPGEVDHRADIYSLGVVFYEMLTGELPLGRFALPSQKVQVDVRLDEVVLRTLEQKPERRYQHASEVKSEVETIAGYLDKLPPHIRSAIGYEYRSKTQFFGLPLVHVVSGVDPRTGKARVARGVFAFGGRARGFFAFGGEAIGVVAFGGLAIGAVALGGVGIGLCSLSGLALALIFGYGGVVVAPLALGGMAFGYYALGGLAKGVHANSKEAMEFIGGMSGWKMIMFWWLGFFLVGMATSLLVPLWAKRRQTNGKRP